MDPEVHGELRTATPWNGGFARSGNHVFLGIGNKELAAIRVTDGRVSWRFGADRKFPEKTAPDEPAVRAAGRQGRGALRAGTGQRGRRP